MSLSRLLSEEGRKEKNNNKMLTFCQLIPFIRKKKVTHDKLLARHYQKQSFHSFSKWSLFGTQFSIFVWKKSAPADVSWSHFDCCAGGRRKKSEHVKKIRVACIHRKTHTQCAKGEPQKEIKLFRFSSATTTSWRME